MLAKARATRIVRGGNNFARRSIALFSVALDFIAQFSLPLPVPSHLWHGRGVEAEFVEVVPAFDLCVGRDGQGAQDFLCEFGYCSHAQCFFRINHLLLALVVRSRCNLWFVKSHSQL